MPARNLGVHGVGYTESESPRKKPIMRLVGILFLLVTCSAQQCLEVKTIPTAGICKDYTINLFTCVNTAIADRTRADITSSLNKMDQATCQSSNFCDLFGGTISPDYCKVGGNQCKMFSLPACQTHADCAIGATPFRCCQTLRRMGSLLCTGINTATFDAFITIMKTQAADKGGCRDTDCIAWSSASSLSSTPKVLPALALLAVLAFYLS